MSTPTIRGYKPHTIKDQLRFLCDTVRVGKAMFGLINRMQNFTPGEQVVATALALRTMCQGAGISLEDVMNVAGNMQAKLNRDPTATHYKAVLDYAAGEIARGECETRGLTPESFMEMTGRPSGKLISY